jgi:hypothetical protein
MLVKPPSPIFNHWPTSDKPESLGAIRRHFLFRTWPGSFAQELHDDRPLALAIVEVNE